MSKLVRICELAGDEKNGELNYFFEEPELLVKLVYDKTTLIPNEIIIGNNMLGCKTYSYLCPNKFCCGEVKEVLFEILRYRSSSLLPKFNCENSKTNCEEEWTIQVLPTPEVLAFLRVFLIPEKKVNFLNVSNGSCLKEEELKKYTNEDCCILFSALTHASTLIVISNKYYLFDTLEHHQKMMFNRSGRSVHVGNPEIFQNLSASINVINPFVSRIQDTDSLQGPSNSCAIWTICAYLELSKFKNLSNALVLTPTNLDCQAVFTETVFKNIGKMVSYLSDYQKDSKVHEFDDFILAEANAEINYKIPEKPMFINKIVFEKLLDMSKNIEEQSKKLKPKVMIANDVSALSSTKTQQELIQTSLQEQETQSFQCPESPENMSTQQPENEVVPGLSALVDQLPQGFIDSVKKQQSKLRDKQKTIQGDLEL